MKRLVILFASLFALTLTAQEEARLLRFPDIHGNKIVFSYGGDLYTVDADGGTARKLTTDNGYEMFARFSPDGKSIAFTGQYDGNTEIYLVTANGGVPERITVTPTLSRDHVWDRMGPNNIVMDWKNKTDQIVFRSRMKSFNSFIGELFTVGIHGNMPEQIPVPRGGFCSFSANDDKMAYNRVFREFRTWKRYRGGMADDIWVYDFKSKKVDNITDNDAQDIIPMWHKDRIYFLSDRDDNKRMNLYSVQADGSDLKKHTDFTEFDIKFPALGDQAIVFEYSGFIYKFDLSSGVSNKVPIFIYEDFPNSRGGFKTVADNISNYEISPDGNRALFGARGDVFSVPAKEGVTFNLTGTPGIHERNSKWSPDGKWISYISDRDGEDELFIRQAQAPYNEIRLSKSDGAYMYQPYWSPDSKKLLWADKDLRLRFIDIDSKNITEIDKSETWEFSDYSWAPDSKWITYSRFEYETMNKIYIYSLENKKSYAVTEGWYSSSDPVFSSDGKYLFFVSNRDFNPVYSWTEWNHAYTDMSKIYLVALNSDVPSPFAPKNDEVKMEKKSDKKDKDEKKPEKISVKIDFKSMDSRIVDLPVSASNFFHLSAMEDKVYYQRNGSNDEKPLLFMYDLKEKKETELGQINGYEISSDGKKMLVGQNKKYAVIDLPKAKIELSDVVDVSNMHTFLNKHLEWKQIFNESWRQMREFFYVSNMHGVNWEHIRLKYLPLVDHVVHRADLTYVIGEMIGELNVGHAYVGGGDLPEVKSIKTGLLGAQFEKDKKSGYFQITKILRGENWEKSVRSPLTEIGVNASEGDFIIAIDGKSTNETQNLYSLLIGKAGNLVELTINSKPAKEGARTVIIKPLADEADLYYYNWVQNKIEQVTKLSDGQIGYIHIPDMGRKGLNEFIKYYYPQIRKKGLIIDVRGNGGGNVSPMIIERLRREIAMFTFARNTKPSPNPSGLFYGPLVCLADEFSASDGDLFTYRFKKHNLGKVIGKRTWGGVVGIRGSLPLIDGGDLRKPEFSRFDVSGENWIIEGVGVEPDIEIDNDPAREFAGIDDQLNAAVDHLLNELKNNIKQIPDLPEPPQR